VQKMELLDAVKQLLEGERKFDAKDEIVAKEAGAVIDLVRGAVKDEAVKDANDAVKGLMSELEQKEAGMTKAAEAAAAGAALKGERTRAVSILASAKALGLGVEDALGVLGPQKDGTFLVADAAKDRLIALAGEKNGALETVDGRRSTPVDSAEDDAERAMNAAIERRKNVA